MSEPSYPPGRANAGVENMPALGDVGVPTYKSSRYSGRTATPLNQERFLRSRYFNP
jgi:hypothetical protein